MSTAQELAKATVLAKQEYAFDKLIKIDHYDVDDETQRNNIICDLKYLYLYYNYLNEATLTDNEVASFLYKLYEFKGSTTSLEVLVGITIDTILGIPDLKDIEGLTNIDLSAYVNKNSDIGTGIIYDSVQDVIKLDTEVKQLVSPTITKGAYMNDGVTPSTSLWELYMNDGITPYSVPNSNSQTIIVEKGVKALISARYSYPLPNSNQALPTNISGDWGNTVVGPATYSDDITNNGEFVENYYNLNVTLSKPKSGLIVSGGQVIPATGTDNTNDEVQIIFNEAIYLGVLDSNTINESQILELDTILIRDTKNIVVNNITCTNTQHLYYCYPSSFGNLSSIIMDGVAAIFGAFTKQGTLTITTRTGIQEELNIYRTNDLGAFTNNSLNFS